MATAARNRRPPETYFELVREFPLTAIRDGRHLARASAMLRRVLATIPGDEDRADPGVMAYLDALTVLVGHYEAEHEPVRDAPAKDVLRELIAGSGLSQQKLADATGIAQSTISALLSGARELTPDHMVILARHFGLSPAVFLPRA